MADLRRLKDGAGDSGASVQSIAWNEDGTFKEVVGDRPVVGCSMCVGSVSARSYSEKDYWLTTPVTEILEEKFDKDNNLLYSKFKTGNSIYELTYGDTSLWAKTKEAIKSKTKNNEDGSNT